MNEINEMKMMSSQVLTQHFQFNTLIVLRFVRFVHFVSTIHAIPTVFLIHNIHFSILITMKKYNDLTPVVNTIADALNNGLTIGIKTVNQEPLVVVADEAAGLELSATVGHPRVFHPKDCRAKSSKPVKTITQKKKNSRWWSRFNLEKNIMKMTLLALQDRYPAEESFRQDAFAEKLAAMMRWEVSTAKRHITQAAKMGIINRAVIGTTYHITGVNDIDANTAREEIADRNQAPELLPIPGLESPEGNAIAQEGKPTLELQIEKAVDETFIP